MQNKINLSIDVSKIQKSRLRKNTYTNKNGEEITQTFCDIIVVPIKEKKLIKSGDNWEMYKTGFIVEKGTKDEDTNILGDAIEFENTETQINEQVDNADGVDEMEDLPF